MVNAIRPLQFFSVTTAGAPAAAVSYDIFNRFSHTLYAISYQRPNSMIVEVESSENCEASFFARFKEAGPARPVIQVRLYDRNPAGEWYWVTGWSENAETPACPAYAQRVEDSGAGLAHLVYGGINGLRFKPVTVDEPWSLGSAHQWGETHLSLSSERDLRYAS